jgi:hypothetical protein
MFIFAHRLEMRQDTLNEYIYQENLRLDRECDLARDLDRSAPADPNGLGIDTPRQFLIGANFRRGL